MSETAGEGKPTKEESTTEEPAREDPTKGGPPEGEPTTEEPTTEKPTTEEPTIEKLANEKLTTEEQTTEEPPTEEQTTEEPSTEEPSAEEPSTEDPTTEEPLQEKNLEVKLELRKSVELQQQCENKTLVISNHVSYDEPRQSLLRTGKDQKAGLLAKSEGSDEVDANTLQLMQQQGNLCTLCLVCTLPAACCFWIPMIFFMAAANVPDACKNKDDFALWLRVHGLAPLLVGVFVQALAVVFAIAQSAQLFKFALRTQILVQLLGGCFTIWGWAVYGGGDASCNTAEDVRPRTLALVWLVLGSICLPCVIIGSIRRFIYFDVDSENARLCGGETVGCSRETE